VDLISHGIVDHLYILLRQGNVALPGGEKLRLGGSCDYQSSDRWNQRFAICDIPLSLQNGISGTARKSPSRPSNLDLDQGVRIRSPGSLELI
jgi:hypothetical protein